MHARFATLLLPRDAALIEASARKQVLYILIPLPSFYSSRFIIDAFRRA